MGSDPAAIGANARADIFPITCPSWVTRTGMAVRAYETSFPNTSFIEKFPYGSLGITADLDTHPLLGRDATAAHALDDLFTDC